MLSVWTLWEVQTVCPSCLYRITRKHPEESTARFDVWTTDTCLRLSQLITGTCNLYYRPNVNNYLLCFTEIVKGYRTYVHDSLSSVMYVCIHIFVLRIYIWCTLMYTYICIVDIHCAHCMLTIKLTIRLVLFITQYMFCKQSIK